jgi:O-antigen ligase
MVDKWILAGFFLILPFQWALFSGAAIDIPLARVFALGIILWWLAQGLLYKKISLPKPEPLFFLSTFLCWAAASVWWSLDQGATLRKAIFLLNFIPLFFIFITCLKAVEAKEKVIKAAILGAFGAAALGILQFFSQFIFSVEQIFRLELGILPWFLGSNFGEAVSSYPSLLVNVGGKTLLRASGAFPDPHMFSYYLLLLLPLSYYVAQKEKGFFWKLAPAVLLLGILLSFSRSAYAALFLGAVLLIPTALKNRHIWPPKFLLAAALLTLIFLQSPLLGRSVSSFSLSDGSVQERLRLWQEAGSIFAEHPVVGVGLGSYPLFVKPTASPREPIYVHNLYLDIVVELGIVGLVAFLGFLWSVIPRKKIPKDFMYQRALQFTILLFLAQSLFETPLFSVQVLPLFIFVTSLLYVQKTNH